MTLQRAALGILLVLALLLGVNLAAAANGFLTAFRTYDELALEMPRFVYSGPEEPVRTELVVTNPSDQEVEVTEIELRLDAGVHRVGGGSIRPEQTLAADTSNTFPIDLRIFDIDYVERRAGPSPEWRVSGRIQVELNPKIAPVWIDFNVRRLPES